MSSRLRSSTTAADVGEAVTQLGCIYTATSFPDSSSIILTTTTTTIDPHRAHTCREPSKTISLHSTTAQPFQTNTCQNVTTTMRSSSLLWLSATLLALPNAANSGPIQDSDLTTTSLPADVAPSAVIVRPSDVPSDLEGRSRRGQRLQEALLHLRWLCLCFFGIYRPKLPPPQSSRKIIHAIVHQPCEKESCTYDGCVCVSAAVAASLVMGFLSPVLDCMSPVLSLKILLLPAVGLLSALLFYY